MTFTCRNYNSADLRRHIFAVTPERNNDIHACRELSVHSAIAEGEERVLNDHDDASTDNDWSLYLVPAPRVMSWFPLFYCCCPSVLRISAYSRGRGLVRYWRPPLFDVLANRTCPFLLILSQCFFATPSVFTTGSC